MNSDTKIYVVAPDNIAPFYEPSLTYIDPDIADGDSIYYKSGYSELRAHYWVWKNSLDSEYVGFFQFRRFLNLDGKKHGRPYYIIKKPDAAYFAGLGDVAQYDVIAPIAEYTGESVWERYAGIHRKEDLEAVRSIIVSKYPEYSASAEKYLNGQSEYYCNMYIMKSAVFSDYCRWLFGILDEFDKTAGDIPPRTQGYLAERLFGIWFTDFKDKGEHNWKEVPRLHFWCYDDETHSMKTDKLKCLILPPGTKLRAFVRKKMKTKENKK